MVELKGASSSSSNNLAAEILKILSKYDVQINQIISITSDNGANMIKATKILSKFSMNEEHEVTDEDLNNTYLDNINNLESPSNLHVENIQICRCAAHTTQLCALDVTKDSEIKKYLLYCRNFTKFIRKTSNGFRDAFELRSLKLPKLDCTTRWGSTYKMIQSLLAAKEALIEVESITNKSSEENFENNDSLWEFMESYVTVFTPLQEAIVKFQAENLHYGNFYAEWLKCKMITSKLVQNNTNTLVKYIGEKVPSHPKWDKREKAVTYLSNLWKKYCCVTSKDVADTTVLTPQGSFENEADEMLNSFLADILESPNGEIVHNDVYSKIKNLHLSFMRSGTNVLEFWKERKYSEPELYALSCVCFGIPPTQVTVERAFSTLKLILTDSRNRMNHETLEDILLVKLNSAFINEAINKLSLFEDQNQEH
ncbi:uncharacterized protein [Musca autumnalis]|uniref:uncharacterized protein n=1 Tax=Musca autumnalis TaxID=221902 RepID=UPI003CF7702E